MVFIWGNGKMINFMGKENFFLKMAPIMKEPSLMPMRLEKEDIFIIMVVFIKVEF
jgi:hypothetical protein